MNPDVNMLLDEEITNEEILTVFNSIKNPAVWIPINNKYIKKYNRCFTSCVCEFVQLYIGLR